MWEGGGDRDGESAMPDPYFSPSVFSRALRQPHLCFSRLMAGKKKDLELERRVGLKCECE